MEQWNAKEYLRAMEGMQFALEVYQNAWKCSVGVVGKETSLDHMIMSSDDDDVVMERNKVEDDNFVESSMILAKRLLFLAYCEMDGGQIVSARQRLVRVVSLCLLMMLELECIKCYYMNISLLFVILTSILIIL